MANEDCIILIPARLNATRLPNKPLLKIHGRSMIMHCYDRAVEADVGHVVVCAGDQEILEEVKKNGGEAILTPADLPSGSDRIHYGLGKITDHKKYQRVINLQGDIPNINPAVLKEIATALKDGDKEIVTPVFLENDKNEKNNPAIVKAICHIEKEKKIAPVLYFTRAAAPFGDDSFYHHIGVYGYQRAALEKFVTMPASPLEKIEKLEQLRALENGIKIFALAVLTKPQSVDTPEDLLLAQKIMGG